MTRKKVRPEDIAEQQWGYTKSVMETTKVEAALIEMFHTIYTAAFLHGYKHAKQETPKVRPVIKRKVKSGMV